MLCRFFSMQIVFSLAVTIALSGDARPQKRGYLNSESPAKLSSAHPLPTDVNKGTSRIDELLDELRRSPDDPITLNNLSVAYAAAGQLDKALEAALSSVEIDRASAVARVNLAAVYDRLGQTEQARAQAAVAAELDPNSARARGFLCELELVLGRASESAECYRKLIAAFSEQYDFQLKFSIALLKAGELSEARGILEGMRTTHEGDIRVMNTLANVYFRMKEYEKSAAVLKEAVELEPEEPRLRFNLGMSYISTKNRAAALSQYNLIKESSPELAGKLYRSLFQKYILDVKK